MSGGTGQCFSHLSLSLSLFPLQINKFKNCLNLIVVMEFSGEGLENEVEELSQGVKQKGEEIKLKV